MNEWQVARPYAEGFFAYAQSNDCARDWHLYFSALSNWMQAPAFHRMLTHPLLQAKQKRDFVFEIAGKQKISMSDDLWQATMLLVQNKRYSCIDEVSCLFDRMYMKSRGILKGHLEQAFPLGKSEKKLLEQWLQQRSDQQVELVTTNEPSLIGGFRLSFDDNVWDASVKGLLKRMSLSMAETTKMF